LAFVGEGDSQRRLRSVNLRIFDAAGLHERLAREEFVEPIYDQLLQ